MLKSLAMVEPQLAYKTKFCMEFKKMQNRRAYTGTCLQLKNTWANAALSVNTGEDVGEFLISNVMKDKINIDVVTELPDKML